MLTVDMVLRKAMKGELDLMGPAMSVANELMSIPDFNELEDKPLAQEEKYLENYKKVLLMVAGSAVQKLMMTLSKEQEILMNVADIAIWIYQAESVLLRVQKQIEQKGNADGLETEIAIVQTYFYDCADKINKAGKDALQSFADGDELTMMLMGLKRFTKTAAFNPKNARQLIAQKAIDKNQYCF
jgi:hypothetical protein